MDLRPQIFLLIYITVRFICMRRRISRGANRWLRRARYLRQISGIAIEGHRRTRKSRSSLSPSKISPWVRGRSRSASGVNTGAHAFTHLRVRSYELRAICNACVVHTHACESLRVLPRVMRVHLRAPICAREIAPS